MLATPALVKSADIEFITATYNAGKHGNLGSIRKASTKQCKFNTGIYITLTGNNRWSESGGAARKAILGLKILIKVHLALSFLLWVL